MNSVFLRNEVLTWLASTRKAVRTEEPFVRKNPMGMYEYYKPEIAYLLVDLGQLVHRPSMESD
jgi:hypothetical protein